MKTNRNTGSEVVLEGIPVASGIALGIAHVHDTRHDGGLASTPEYHINDHRVEAERSRFLRATKSAREQIEALRTKTSALPNEAAEELGYLFDAYRDMLRDSRLIRGVLKRIGDEHINAEAAVRRETTLLCDAFTAMDDSYLASRAADVREVGGRLIRNLTRTPTNSNPFDGLARNAIIIARELTPADTALLDPKRIAGFATAAGGAESHTAIMARSLGLPAILAVPELLAAVTTGDAIILDGVSGRVIVRPTDDTLAEYRRRRADSLRQRRSLSRLRDLHAETIDGVSVHLSANIEMPGDVTAALAAGAEGIGLFRSEFLFMNRATLPSEDEQFNALKAVVVGMAGRPVTVRVLDSGGEKLIQARLPNGEIISSQPANPALGLRGIRFLLAVPSVLETQLAAILRAAVFGPIRILLPMIATVEEVVAVRQCVTRVYQRLQTDNPAQVPEAIPPVGVMIEVPGAALAADALAAVSDFFAIGTNDLTQYTLAIDRSDKAVAHLYNPMHPAVLRLIHFTTGAAQRAGIPVSLCGEIAGDPRLARLLLGLGIRELSMTANSIPKVKQSLRKAVARDLEKRADRIMRESSAPVLESLLREFA